MRANVESLPAKRGQSAARSVDKGHTTSYIPFLPVFRWGHDKNKWLKKTRGISFEEIVLLLEKGQVFDIVEHPDPEKYPGQRIAIVEIDAYAYLVPYVQQGKEIFLKTVIPSRKATMKYLGGSHEKDE